MSGNPADGTVSERGARQSGVKIPVVLLAGLVIAILALVGIGARYYLHRDLNLIHAFLSLFFSINLLICYWEASLILRRDYIEKRAKYWREWKRRTGRAPSSEFLLTRVPLSKVLSQTLWADVWATYSLYDGSYADRRTYGYIADVANGIVTPTPTLILYVAYTSGLLPAVFAGVLGVMMFWQLTHMTSAYWISFFLAGRQTRISRSEMYIYIWGTNCPWALSGLLGLYVSVRLVVDGNYGVLGM